MIAPPIRLVVLCLSPLLVAGALIGLQPSSVSASNQAGRAPGEIMMNVHYLEIVTPAVEDTCKALAQAHGVVFSEPVPAFGNARTTKLENGGRIGVRAPMRDTEEPIVRPYILVEDIQAAVKAAEDAGATVALPPMEIPGEGLFSIYILGGIEHGLWQN